MKFFLIPCQSVLDYLSFAMRSLSQFTAASEFVGFVQVNNLKKTLNRLVFTVHRFSMHLYLKIPGFMLCRLSISHVSRTPL